MHIMHGVRESIMRTFSRTPQKGPLAETAARQQYYVAGIVMHPETGEAMYALLKLLSGEVEAIRVLDRRLAAGDKSVRDDRKRFFDRHRDGCVHAVGSMGRCGLGDLLSPGEVSFTPCAGARARIPDIRR